MNDEILKEALFTALVVIAIIPMLVIALIEVKTKEDLLLILIGVTFGLAALQILEFFFDYTIR